jgi:uncharacterized protein (TIGR02246 family)
MKRRLVVPFVGLAISFALPTYAQQKDLADPQTTQKILASVKAYDEAMNDNDAAAIAALFTRDAVFVTTEGPIIGRQAIEKWYADVFQWWHPKNHIIKVDGNAFHLIGTAGNELWATGEWSETGQGKNHNLSPSRAIGQGLMFVRSMIGRSEWTPGTLPRTVCYASTRVSHTTGRNGIPDRQP